MSVQEIIGILVSLAAAASYINCKVTKLPKSIGITLITLVLSLLLAIGGRFSWDIDYLAKTLLDGVEFDDTFLHGMLSFLLFAGSMHINLVELSKYKSLVAFLATISVATSTIMIGYCMHWLTQWLGIDLPFYYCLVFGALISPTDPIAVLGVLKRVKAPKSLELKIAGEALFNDGMGIVLFFVALAVASGSQKSITPKEFTLIFMQQGVGGLVVGSVIGWFASKLIRTVNDYEVAIILTLAVVTGGYTLAHSILHVSGPISIATAGLIIGSTIRSGSMSNENIKRLDAFWDLLDAVLSAILFVLIGLEFMSIKFNLETTIAAIGAIAITLIARWISIFLPVGYLSRFRKFDSNVLVIMTWGGLRGGISIALALGIQGRYHDFIVTVTYAVVIFSIMVQGLTIGPLIKKLLNLNKTKEAASIELSDSEPLQVSEEGASAS